MQDMNIKNLVGGTLLSSDARISLDVSRDALDSLLFFQLYADKKSSRFDSLVDWLHGYDKAMIQLKWNSVFFNSVTIPPPENACFTLDALIGEKLKEKLPDKQIEAFMELMACMGSLARDAEASLLFRQQAIRPSADFPGRSDLMLQMGIMEQGIRLSSLFVTFSTTSEVEHDLWHQTFSGATIAGAIQLRVQEREWNPKDNSIIRGKPVQGFLAGEKDGLVLPISCGTPEEAIDD
jgi:hypothetical protein